jgi:hypothetical protein
MGKTSKQKKARIGYDYVHSVVDDCSRFAYSEILPDERAGTCAQFFARAVEAFASYGITIERLITDNHWSYRHSNELRALLEDSTSPTSSFVRTAHRRTARSNSSTAHCRSSGHTGRFSRATPNA